jgi:hypothetical protein
VKEDSELLLPLSVFKDQRKEDVLKTTLVWYVVSRSAHYGGPCEDVLGSTKFVISGGCSARTFVLRIAQNRAEDSHNQVLEILIAVD